MSDEISITFTCKSCGADPATLTLPDDHTDDDIAKCKACGAE
jgi:transcription elongation factor Elf1